MNVVLILVDDMGWKDISCMGSSFYETPNIDRLAKEGMLFTDAYAACPVCSPTRASVMSGKYPARVGVTDWINHRHQSDSSYGHACGYLYDAPYIDHLPLEERSIATTLREHNYQTWHVGKWHLGVAPYYPEHHGFDANIGGCMVGSPPGPEGYFSPWPNNPALKDVDVPPHTYLTDYLADKTIELLKNRDKNRPFFLNMWPYQVHTPLQAKPEKIAKYQEKAKKLGLDKIDNFEEGDFFPTCHKCTERISRRLLQSNPVYAAMIESLDEWVGRVLDELDIQGIADDTMVIFTSDNGGLATAEGAPTCNAPLAEGKGWTKEGGVREPLLVRYPKKIAANSRSNTPVISTDFYPTILDVAGLPLIPEQHVDGCSLKNILFNIGSIEREAIFWHYPHYGNQGDTPSSAIRSGAWKLIEHFEDNSIELFNLADDIEEKNNLAEINLKERDNLLALLHNWQKDINAKIPERNIEFVPWSNAHKTKGYMPYD